MTARARSAWRYAMPQRALVGELAIRVYDRGPEPDWHTDRTLFGPWLPFEAELVGHEGATATGWSRWEAIYGLVAAHGRELDGRKGGS
ncbi:MAG: hypothetical protein ACRDPC_00895 [Solirubrobacteraceae bacterium]